MITIDNVMYSILEYDECFTEGNECLEESIFCDHWIENARSIILAYREPALDLLRRGMMFIGDDTDRSRVLDHQTWRDEAFKLLEALNEKSS